MADETPQLELTRSVTLFIKHILRKVFLEDWAMKLAALVITLALWLGVTGLSTPTTQRLSGVPLSLRFSNDIEVTNSPIEEVDIVISGDRRRISQINKNDLVISLDISDMTPGDRVLQLTPENVNLTLPTGIRLDEIQPSRVPVRIEAVEEKDVPVQAVTTGQLPEGYEIYERIVTPPRVRVRGPSGFIRSLDFVSTERIDLSGRTTDFKLPQVPVSILNPHASIRDTLVVDVAFRIGERRLERLYLVPVKDDPTRRATVVLYGGRSLFEGITPQDLQVEIARTESGETTPRLTLPPGLEGKVEIRRVRVN